MRGTNVIGLIIAVFLCFALCMNGVMQEQDRSRYIEVEAKVVNVEDSHYFDGDDYISRFTLTLQYISNGKAYSHTMFWYKKVAPGVNTTRPLYIESSNPENVMDSGIYMREIGTFALAGVSLVWAIFQLFMGIKHANSSAEVRSSYFILMVGILITLSAIPLAYFLYDLVSISMYVALVGLIVTAWGIKDISSLKKKKVYAEYEFRR